MCFTHFNRFTNWRFFRLVLFIRFNRWNFKNVACCGWRWWGDAYVTCQFDLGIFFQKLFIRILMKFKIHWLWNFVATLKPNSWSYHKLLFFLQRFYRKTSLDKQNLISPLELSVSMWSVQQRQGGKGAKHDILQSVIWEFFCLLLFWQTILKYLV